MILKWIFDRAVALLGLESALRKKVSKLYLLAQIYYFCTANLGVENHSQI